MYASHLDVLRNLTRMPSCSYLSAKSAGQDQLAYINDAGNAIMKVDNTSTLNVGANRNSIRISTKDHFTVGSMWITDMVHVPYGVRSACVGAAVSLADMARAVLRMAGVLVFRTRLAEWR